MSWFSQVFDVTLLATIGLIVAVSLVLAYARSSRRDVCLQCFEGYHVTLERNSGKVIWGVMELESTGLELRYRDAVQDANHVESSYVLYSTEFGNIQALYRYADDLDDGDRVRRDKDIRRSAHPSLLTRIKRSAQHFFSLAGDSLAEALGAIVGSLRKPAGRYINDTGEKQLKQLGSTVIGSVGRAYDPLLERLVGQKVVVEIVEDGEVHEHVGVLKSYSPDFIALLDVQYPQRQAHPIRLGASGHTRGLTAAVDGQVVRVHNNGSQPMLIVSLQSGGDEELLNAVVDKGETIEIHTEKAFDQADLNVRVIRELDMIVPRTRCVVRHRAERYEQQIIPEIVFDLGFVLTGSSLTDAREKRLRQRLVEDPRSASLMSNLGALLLQKQRYGEAEELLERAYGMRLSLPDSGRRTAMLLNELRRRRTKSPDMASTLRALQYELGNTGSSTRGTHQELGGSGDEQPAAAESGRNGTSLLRT